MSAKPGPRRSRLDSILSVRFTPAEADGLRRAAGLRGLSLSQMLREAAFRESERTRREAAHSTDAEVADGRIVPWQAGTAQCSHFSIGGVMSVECSLCGPLAVMTARPMVHAAT